MDLQDSNFRRSTDIFCNHVTFVIGPESNTIGARLEAEFIPEMMIVTVECDV